MKQRRKRVSGLRVPPPPAQRPRERWSLDFLTDSLVDGRRFRISVDETAYKVPYYLA